MSLSASGWPPRANARSARCELASVSSGTTSSGPAQSNLERTSTGCCRHSRRSRWRSTSSSSGPAAGTRTWKRRSAPFPKCPRARPPPRVGQPGRPRRAYAGAAVFCFPSLLEGFGFPVVEAMAHGTPVVRRPAPRPRSSSRATRVSRSTHVTPQRSRMRCRGSSPTRAGNAVARRWARPIRPVHVGQHRPTRDGRVPRASSA